MGGEIGGSALPFPTTTPGLSPPCGTPHNEPPPPRSAGPRHPQRGALPPPGLRDLGLPLGAATPLARPPPAASLAATFQRLLQPLDVHDPPGRFPRGSARLPRPSPAQTGPRSQRDPALSDAPTWRPRRARARPRGPARRGRGQWAGPMGGPAGGGGVNGGPA